MEYWKRLCGALLLGGAILATAAPASAGTYIVTGSRQNANPLNPPGTGRCAPGNTVNIAPGALSSTGVMSVFGAFTSTQSHCIAGPPPNPLTDGIFSYDFGGGNILSGIYTGLTSLSGTPGVFTAQEFLTVTGGTGTFLGATGYINTLGTLSFANGVGTYSGDLSGQLTVAVPEPASWGMMIGGFALAGAAVRRRQPARALA